MPKEFSPTFSIITVCYNAAPLLEHTLRSVAEQDYAHIEYIVIDGSSTDNTSHLLSKYSASIHQVISEPDKGIYDAMNKGLALATGDYVCFLNAGDTFYKPYTLSQIVETVAPDVIPDVIYGETAIINNERHFISMRRLQAPTRLDWKSFRDGMLVCHQAFFARRTLAQPYDLNYRYSADFDWCIRVMQQAKVLHNTKLILVNYLHEGVTTRHRHASLRERMNIMARHYGWTSTLFRHVWFIIRLVTKP